LLTEPGAVPAKVDTGVSKLRSTKYSWNNDVAPAPLDTYKRWLVGS
jgi:hypothetical protein